MAHNFRLLVGINGSEPQALAVEIPDNDWTLLLRFLEDFEILAATRMGAKCEVKFRLTFDPQTGVSYSGELPAPDDVAAFLHRLRPFILVNEPANFDRVCSILGRAVAHQGLRAVLRKQRDEFSGKAFLSQIQLSVNGQLVNSETALQHWLNAYEYHRDIDRRNELAEVHCEELPLDATRPIFVSMMIDKAKAVAEVAAIVRLLVQGKRGAELRFRQLKIHPQEDA